MVSEVYKSGFDSLGIEGSSFLGAFAGGVVGTVLAVGILIALIVIAALYVYQALAWYRIAKKLKHKNPWLAWIPFAATAMRLQLGGFHWAWIFLILIPVLGWIALFVMSIISNWRIFEKRKYPGWFSLSVIIPKVGGILYLIAIGFVAWGKK
jgi:hypothetical protein